MLTMVTIHFEDDQKSIQVEIERSLSDICDEYPTSVLFGCREAVCGTCLVEVLGGLDNLSPITDDEQELLSVLAPDNSRARLACQCVVRGDIRIATLDQ